MYILVGNETVKSKQKWSEIGLLLHILIFACRSGVYVNEQSFRG